MRKDIGPYMGRCVFGVYTYPKHWELYELATREISTWGDWTTTPIRRYKKRYSQEVTTEELHAVGLTAEQFTSMAEERLCQSKRVLYGSAEFGRFQIK